jgi:hypothetical protein
VNQSSCIYSMGYFFCWIFFICGQNELRATTDVQFKLHSNMKDEVFVWLHTSLSLNLCLYFFSWDFFLYFDTSKDHVV